MKEMKRIIALLLCFVMLVGIMPVNAIATEGEGSSAVTPVSEEGSSDPDIGNTDTEGGNTDTEGGNTDTEGGNTDTEGGNTDTEEDELESEDEITETTTETEGSDEPVYPVMPADLQTLSKSELKAALDEAKSFVDGITINNPSNDPATVVSNFGTHFTWDNEKREGKKDYLYDWSYYNGVVFEGLEYVYEVTGESVYKDYVVEYMSSLINSNGGWAACANNSGKTCAGYKSTHGADCYKTASLLLDAYEMTGDNRYLTMAAELYKDLNNAEGSYLLSNAGYNFRHTWASDPSPDLWLDGLYMILPFRAEYAKYTGDTAELDQIVSRLQWVSDYMYNETSHLFYHAADSASSNSGTYWLRSMGWYAAAMVDVMDSMSGSNLTAMKAQLAKMVDGMRGWQKDNGMWLNDVTGTESTSNPYEPSGTALIGYAIMKAVNKGWLDKSYLDMATNALAGICNVKLKDGNLYDVCYIGAPGSANATFKTNEGKGVGPFIMLYAEVLDYYNDTYPTVTGISVSEGDEYVVGDTLAPTVTATYSNGTKTAVSGYTVDGDYDMNNPGEYTVQVTYGGYTVDYSFTVVESDVVMTALEVTAQPTTTKYFASDEAVGETLPLSIAGLEITASFSDGTTKVVVWDEFGKVADGYSLSFDMSKLGEQDVAVNYAWGGVNLTTTFKISIYNKTLAAEGSKVSIEVNVPGVTDMTVTENTDDESVVAAMEGVMDTYVSYDIVLEGHNEGEKVTVTLPLPKGVTNPAVYHIGETAEKLPITGYTADGSAVMFETDHFSTYAVGDSRAVVGTGSVEGTGNLVGGKVYTLDTDGVTANKNYLIVNTGSNGTGYALTNNNDNPDRTAVTISNSTITVEDDANIAWIFNNSTYGNISNNGRYVYLGNNSLSLNTNSSNMTISGNNGAYYITRSGKNTYYLRYNNGWTGSTTNSYVYLYEYTSASAGEAVTFTVTPESATIMPDETVTLTGAVTVDGDAVSLSNCTITWASSNEYASVSNGTVTGIADGTENITATLSAVNGTALQENIVLTIPITVQSKKVVGITAMGMEGFVQVDSSSAVTTGTMIQINYDDGTSGTAPVTVGMLTTSSGAEVSTATVGKQEDLTISYEGFTIDGYTLNVEAKPDYNYPEYPDPGSVEVNKVAANTDQFQNTGVAEIQLSTSGVPIKTGVDVVLIADISNSMAWKAGEKNTSPGNGETTKWQDLQSAAGTFVDSLLADHEDGTATANTVSFVTFGGYDAQRNNNASNYSGYFDSVRTVFTSESDAADAKSAINAFSITGNDGDGYTVSINGSSAGTPQGGTNYDYAFLEAASAINQIKAEYAAANGGASYDDSKRQIYVVFMTDGAPDHYNQLYYKSRSSSQFDYNALYYKDGDPIGDYATSMTGYTRHVDHGYFMPSTGSISNADWTAWLKKDSLAAAEAVKAIKSVNSITAIGFDLENGAFSTYTFGEEVLTPVLQNLAGENSCKVLTTADSEQLSAFYASLASEIKQAATEAYFIDPMGGSFDIQTAAYVTKFDESTNEYNVKLTPAPQITVSTYNVYTSNDVGKTIGGVTVTQAMVGQRYGNPTVKETVVFSIDGKEAYSSTDGYTSQEVNLPDVKDADGNALTVTSYSGTNIIDNGVIVAENFWYNTTDETKTIEVKNADGTVKNYPLAAETFYWNIGTINNTEFVLSYYVALEGAAEGEAKAGSYSTNGKTVLYYKNWLDNDASQEVQTPSVSWESASVSYGFYLVNENGVPVTNRADGTTGSFYDAVKVTQKVPYDTILLNTEESVTISVNTLEVLPEGYEPYDSGATYTITVDSNNTASGWEIKNTKTPDTTYVTDYSGTLATNETEISGGNNNYTNTTVWFAVIWKPSTVPDTVVVDYGLPVDIDVTYNDMFGSNGTLIGVSDETKKPVKNAHDHMTGHDSAFVTEYASTYGNASVLNGKVRYEPTTMVWKANADTASYDKFAYEVRYKNENVMEYYYGDVTVIPATIVYYEDDFTNTNGDNYITLGKYNADGTDFDADGDGKNDGWITVQEPESSTDATQAEDRPGYYNLQAIDANNIYGYDAAYANMSKYSMGSVAMVNVDANSYATATFDFYGTGFDVIGMTSNTTGTLIIQVLDPSNNNAVVATRLVDTYYGYKWQQVSTDEDGNPKYGWVDVNYAGTNAEPNTLYQVPVMKINGLTYGKYTAKITASYGDFFDHTKEEPGYDLYLDAIRIYDPAGAGNDKVTDDSTIADIYEMDHENQPDIQELRNMILTAGVVNNLTADSAAAAGIVFIDGNNSLQNGNSVDGTAVSDYTNYGPNNELYLAPGQAVAFNLYAYAPYGYMVDSVQMAYKSVGGTAYAKVYDGAASTASNTTARTVSTATDLYYDITGLNGSLAVVMNSGTATDAILSITNVKVTYKAVEEVDEATEALKGYIEAQESWDLAEEEYTAATWEAYENALAAANAAMANADATVESVTAAHKTLENAYAALQSAEGSGVAAASFFSVDSETAPVALMSMRRVTVEEPEEPLVTEPVVPETTEPVEPETTVPEETEPEEFDPSVSVNLSSKSVKSGNGVLVTVITSGDVAELDVNGKPVSRSTVSRLTGRRTWITTVTARGVGTMPIKVVAYNAEGLVADPVVKTVTVTAKTTNIVDAFFGWLFR